MKIRDKSPYPISCKEIKDTTPSSADGNYIIDPDGVSGNAPFQVYCDMTTNGGGWTRISSQVTSDSDRLQWLTYAI